MQLLASVKDATEQGRLKWAETIDEETFRVVLKGAIIRLSRVCVDDVNGIFGVVATLADDDGNTLDILSVMIPMMKSRTNCLIPYTTSPAKGKKRR